MSSQAKGLLIEGDFTPGKEPRGLKIISRLLGIVLAFSAILTVILYGILVHYEMDINDTGMKTRQINETNKELLVKLNQIQSYRNVEKAAAQVPQLNRPSEIIEILNANTPKLADPPKRQGVLPRATGY